MYLNLSDGDQVLHCLLRPAVQQTHVTSIDVSKTAGRIVRSVGPD